MNFYLTTKRRWYLWFAMDFDVICQQQGLKLETIVLHCRWCNTKTGGNQISISLLIFFTLNVFAFKIQCSIGWQWHYNIDFVGGYEMM